MAGAAETKEVRRARAVEMVKAFMVGEFDGRGYSGSLEERCSSQVSLLLLGV